MPLSDRNYRSLEYEDEGLNYGGEDTTVGGVLPTVNNDTTIGGLSALQTGKPSDSSISPLDYTQTAVQPAPLGVSDQTGLTSGVLPVSRDEAQQTAIDAATVKPAANTYNGIPIPTFTDKYIDRGDEGTQILSAADQLTSWKQNQDYLASLTPAQRAIQNAARTESQENALVTHTTQLR